MQVRKRNLFLTQMKALHEQGSNRSKGGKLQKQIVVKLPTFEILTINIVHDALISQIVPLKLTLPSA